MKRKNKFYLSELVCDPGIWGPESNSAWKRRVRGPYIPAIGWTWNLLRQYILRVQPIKTSVQRSRVGTFPRWDQPTQDQPHEKIPVGIQISLSTAASIHAASAIVGSFFPFFSFFFFFFLIDSHYHNETIVTKMLHLFKVSCFSVRKRQKKRES